MIKRGNVRGLSTIVATLLIILLTLVAVGIVWVVIRNVINQGAEQVSLGKFTLNLEIKSVSIDPSSPSNVNVRIRRNPGEGEISGLNFIVDDGDTTEVVKMVNFSLNELEERTINLSLKTITNSSKIVKVSVAPIFRLESGKDVTGDVKDEYEMPITTANGGTVCTPNCVGKNCGSDGCGGICGSCGGSTPNCVDYQCTANPCTPNCVGKNCGSDGCSGTCGTCTSPQVCNSTGICAATCTPNCVGKNCGSDGCSGTCGTCTSPQTCNATGICATSCTAESDSVFCSRLGKNCGSVTANDNCGNQRTVTSCGTCTSPQTCNSTNQCASPSAPAWQFGMVSWWRFNGDAKDYTGRNNGTVSGATLTSTNCKSGQCYSFDGNNDLINLSKLSGGWNDLGAMSVSVWIRPVSVSGGSGNTIFGKKETEGPPWGFWSMNLLSGNEIYYHRDTSASNFDVYSLYDSVTMGQMQNVVMTWTGSGTTGSMHFYVNGVETEYDSEHWDGSDSDNGLNNYYIGNIGDRSLPFNGIIDEVMIFNRSLSSSEVQQIYAYNYP